MRAMIHVAARELVERKLIFVACFVMGLMTLAFPLVPGIEGENPKTVITFAGVTGGLGVGVALALMMGATVLSRDLAERRLSFYFAKPLSHWTIWGGKIVGAILMTAVGGFLVFLPSTFAGGGVMILFKKWDAEAPIEVAVMSAVLLFLIAIAHFASLALRARSKWVALDIFGLLAVGLIVWQAMRPLLTAAAFQLSIRVGIAFGIALLAATLAAGAIGVARGRVDIRIVHGATSIALVSLLGLAALATALFSVWVRRADLHDLNRARVAAHAAAGDWVAVEGNARGRLDYQPAFLVNPVTGAAIRIPSQTHRDTIDFSADGKKAVWGDLVSVSPLQADLFFADLTDGNDPKVTPLLVSFNPIAGAGPAMSADGTRIAITQDDTLSIYDVASRRSIATTKLRLPETAWTQVIEFFGNDVVRIHTMMPNLNDRTKRTTVIHEYDIAARKLEQVATFQGYRGTPSSTRDRMLASIPWAGGHVILDRNAGVIKALSAEGEKVEAARWITGDRIAALAKKDDLARLHILDMNGIEISVIEVGNAKYAYLGAEPEPGKITVSLERHEKAHLYLIDVASRTSTRVADDLRPAVWSWALVAPGSAGSRMYRDREEGLVYFDPATKERKQITTGTSGARS